MCVRPVTRDDKTFACRSCDACIANRRHQWEARACMERAVWPHALSVTLSYDDSTQENRDAAAMFQYSDVRGWLARLRAALAEKQEGATLRFLIAGEQGDRNKRCHWHCIIFSTLPIWNLGEVVGFKRGEAVKVRLSEWSDMRTTANAKRRLDWSLWGKGFVTFQECDQGSIHYVLSYVTKDQFAADKSKGSMREAKTDVFSTGLFRMSKRPAIGETWLFQKLARLDESNSVLPNLNMTVPGLSGFYHPAGSFRQKVLWALVALNQRAVWATGRNAPQWSSLIHSLQDMEPDLEVLLGQKGQDEKEWRDRVSAIVLDVESRQRVNRCAAELPCDSCLSALGADDLASLGLFRAEGGQILPVDSERDVSSEQRAAARRVHSFCRQRGSDELARALGHVLGDRAASYLA